MELFDAEQWEDGPRGLVRLRVDGRWKDAPDGSRLYYNSAGVTALVQAMLSGTMPHAAPRPLLRVGQPVYLPCAPYDRNGFAWGSEMGRILSESAVMGIDGRWYVIVWGMKIKPVSCRLKTWGCIMNQLCDEGILRETLAAVLKEEMQPVVKIGRAHV